MPKRNKKRANSERHSFESRAPNLIRIACLLVGGIAVVVVIIAARDVAPKVSPSISPSNSPSALPATANNPLGKATQPPLPIQQDDPLPVLSKRFRNDDRQAERTTLDPANTPWDTEVFHEQADHILKSIAKLLQGTDAISSADVEVFVTKDFFCSELVPDSTDQVYATTSLTVHRADGPLPASKFRGAAGFANALTALRGDRNAVTRRQVKLKQFKVSRENDGMLTSVYLHSGAEGQDSRSQVNATWACHWNTNGTGEAPLLTRIEVLEFDEVTAKSQGDPAFSDCTAAVLDANPSFREQLSQGLNHWLNHIDRTYGMSVFGRHGLAVGDYNGDGLDDLYVCQPGGLPNRLYLQQANGTALDVSQRVGADVLDHSTSALFVDLDNDGDQDLVMALRAGLLVLRQGADGNLALGARLSNPDQDVQSLSAADFDGDGDLDIYLCLDFAGENAREAEERPGFLYHDANDGGANVLYRNDGVSADGGIEFLDVTREVGLDANNRRHSLAAAWGDYDDDGDLDLYVANDYGRNCLYRNDDGNFVNLADAAGVVDYGSGMSATWGDFDRDGRMDLLVGNMFSAAGNRIATQERFYVAQAKDAGTQDIYKRFAKGNSLFRNLGSGKFEEVGRTAGVEVAGWAWSSVFVDVNNDAWQDLLVGNGYISTDDTGDL